MNSIKLSAPAKVNLFLNVLNKRKDGYHNLHTLFERISLADEISISKTPSSIIVTSDKFITRNQRDNLVYKAAELILRHKKVKSGVKIHIKKNIPIAAGLGGGSSDAASVLIGLNRLFNLNMKQKELVILGRKLGADVPFFLIDEPFAIGTGRGDKLKKISHKNVLWHLIIYPGFKLATKDIYAAFDSLTRRGKDVKIHRSKTGSFDLESPGHMLYNDLEEMAIAKKSVLGSIVERLAYHLGRAAIVSGSGPSVFCLCRTGKEAIAARKKLFRSVPALERKRWQIFIARTAA